jgi:hypothetical protein
VIENAILRLVDGLRKEGISTRQGVTLQMLDDFDAKYQVRLPADMRAYFRAFDGMDEGEYTSAHFRFWPLSAVQPVGLEVDGASGDDLAGYFGFADFLSALTTTPSNYGAKTRIRL